MPIKRYCDQKPSGLPEVLADERGHPFNGFLGDRRGNILQYPFARALENMHVDGAAGPTVLPDELVEVGTGVRLLIRAGQAQRGREFHALAGGQGPCRRGLDHVLLGLPVQIVHRHDALGHAGRRG